MYTIGSSKAGTTLAGVASEHKIAGWDGTTFKYETEKKDILLAGCNFLFRQSCGPGGTCKSNGGGGGGTLGQGHFQCRGKATYKELHLGAH